MNVNSNLTNYVSIETCNSTSETFQRKTNAWISNTTIPGSQEQFLLIHPHCPYDYCRSENEHVDIKLNTPDGYNVQCAFNRTGILCGQCLPNFSLSLGSSRCVECGNLWPGALLGITLLAIIFGIGLVCALLFLNLTVAIGTINGILFYANIINGNKSIFFKGLPSSSFPSLFTAWLNLEIGFDVCLYKGLDTYAKTWLQLLFPIYLIGLVAAVIVISKYSQRFANLIGKRNPVATLATLMLLFYAKFISIVITILSVTTLQYPDGERLLWKPDATIRYLEFPKHALLLIFAMAILLLGATYTIFTLSWQILIRLPNWTFVRWLRNPKAFFFMETYRAPYTTRYRYWSGLLVFIRVIVYLVTALNTSGDFQVPLLVTALLVGGLLLLVTLELYKKKPASVLEMISLSNILVFTLITWYSVGTRLSDNRLHHVAAHISVSIMFLQLLIVLLYHLYTFTSINSYIKSTMLYATINTLACVIRKLCEAKDQVPTAACSLDAETRDVNLFELVTQTNSSTGGEQRLPQVHHQQLPTVSIVEIARH